MDDPNRLALQLVARELGEMVEEVVFVGGAVAGVLITDSFTARIRATKDVDCIVEVSTRSEYDSRIRNRLLKCGFHELIGEGVPVCAWHKDGIRLDVMPTNEAILGFSSPWYSGAMKTAERIDIGGIEIHVISAPYFLATKLVAFKSRGRGDFLSSHDMEDVIAVVDGRPTLPDEVMIADDEVKAFLQMEIKLFLNDDNFLSALPGLVLDTGRDAIVRERLRNITKD